MHQKMESMPGRSRNSFPSSLFSRTSKRRVQRTFIVGTRASWWAHCVLKVLRELEKCANFFFWWPSFSEDSKISDIHDIFSNVSIF